MITEYGTSIGNTLTDFANAHMSMAIKSAKAKLLSSVPVSSSIPKTFASTLVSKASTVFSDTVKSLDLSKISSTAISTSKPLPKNISDYLTTKNILIASGIGAVLLMIGIRK